MNAGKYNLSGISAKRTLRTVGHVRYAWRESVTDSEAKIQPRDRRQNARNIS